MRVAALAEVADVSHRDDAKLVVEQAIALERELWSGEPSAVRGLSRALRDRRAIEELLRTILRRGVTGEIGTDFRAAADEALLADGLAFGEGSPTELGTDTEWDFEAIEIEAIGARADAGTRRPRPSPPSSISDSTATTRRSWPHGGSGAAIVSEPEPESADTAPGTRRRRSPPTRGWTAEEPSSVGRRRSGICH